MKGCQCLNRIREGNQYLHTNWESVFYLRWLPFSLYSKCGGCLLGGLILCLFNHLRKHFQAEIIQGVYCYVGNKTTQWKFYCLLIITQNMLAGKPQHIFLAKNEISCSENKRIIIIHHFLDLLILILSVCCWLGIKIRAKLTVWPSRLRTSILAWGNTHTAAE